MAVADEPLVVSALSGLVSEAEHDIRPTESIRRSHNLNMGIYVRVEVAEIILHLSKKL